MTKRGRGEVSRDRLTVQIRQRQRSLHVSHGYAFETDRHQNQARADKGWALIPCNLWIEALNGCWQKNPLTRDHTVATKKS